VAEQENVEKNESPEPPGQPSKGLAASILPWLITGLVVVVFAAGGFLFGRLFGTRGQAQTASGAERGQPAESASSRGSEEGAKTGESWYYDLDPVVANLNEPGVTRYVRMGLTLEISNTLKEEEGKAFLDQKRPLLKHWLTLFLSNQTLDEARGENLVRLQTRLSDVLNQGLFPGAKPQIKSVLFKEFAIQ